MAKPAITAKRTRASERNAAPAASTAMPTPMQLRMSTLVSSVALACGMLKAQLVKRKVNAMARM